MYNRRSTAEGARRNRRYKLPLDWRTGKIVSSAPCRPSQWTPADPQFAGPEIWDAISTIFGFDWTAETTDQEKSKDWRQYIGAP